MTLLQVSLSSAKLFPGEPLYRVPHSLYSDLRNDRFTPNLYQLVGLSAVTGYALPDWLSVFGFRLNDIVRLQIQLSFPKTILLDTTLYDAHDPVRWFEQKQEPINPITPLIQILSQSVPERIGALRKSNMIAFLYAKVGTEDGLSYPELLPGSIVRADPRDALALLAASEGRVSRHLFLVEHTHGLNCCRLQQLATGRVALVSTNIAAPRLELRLDSELKILGTIDMEIRSFHKTAGPLAPSPLHRRASTEFTDTAVGVLHLRRLLLRGRRRSGFSFRAASALSGEIAATLNDTRYFAAIGSLSDYETADAPPRHLHKVITLCILYAIDFWRFLHAAGIATAPLGTESIPDDLISRTLIPDTIGRTNKQTHIDRPDTFLAALANRLGEIPLFLRNALPGLSGMARVSLRDFFWVQEGTREFDMPLRGAILLAINRRIKTPSIHESQPQWNQPIYLLVRRDGSYFLGWFTRQNKATVLLPLAPEVPNADSSSSRSNAEIVGQVASAVRLVRTPS
jgi:hypothetical protein